MTGANRTSPKKIIFSSLNGLQSVSDSCYIWSLDARVAELVDACASGAYALTGVEVQVLSRVQN